MDLKWKVCIPKFIYQWILPADGSKKPKPYFVEGGIGRYKKTHQNFQVKPRLYNIQCEYLLNKDTYRKTTKCNPVCACSCGKGFRD